MKCLVCNKEFEGSACPRCVYPVVEATDVDALLDSLRPQIEAYRKEFELGIRIELVIFRWKEAEGNVVLDRKETMSFGRYPELVGRATWLPQQFARIPDAQTLELQLQITSADTTRTVSVPVQNLLDPALQNVGIEVSGDYRYRLMLKNDTGKVTASEWLEI